MATLGIAAALVYARVTQRRSASARVPDDGEPIGLWSPKKYLALGIGYAAYGFGYICVLTIFGAALVRTHAASLGFAVIILGASGTIGALVWGPLVDRLRNGVPLAIACALCAIGAFALGADRAPLVLCGALVLGVSFIGVPAMIGALAQQREPGRRYARAFATLTSTLGVGQIVGPFAGGLVAEHFGTTAALELGSAALAVAALSCGFYRRPSEVEIDTIVGLRLMVKD
jgi:MFS family permease